MFDIFLWPSFSAQQQIQYKSHNIQLFMASVVWNLGPPPKTGDGVGGETQTHSGLVQTCCIMTLWERAEKGRRPMWGVSPYIGVCCAAIEMGLELKRYLLKWNEVIFGRPLWGRKAAPSLGGTSFDLVEASWQAMNRSIFSPSTASGQLTHYHVSLVLSSSMRF